MTLKLFLAIAFWLSDSSSGEYLTCKLDYHSRVNFTRDPYIIEFWPDYIPLDPWVVDNDNCRYDVKIEFIPFQQDRMIDYDAKSIGVLPTINMRFFSGKNLQSVFDKLVAKSTDDSPLACSYDTVWYDPPSRFYAFHGFKVTVFDQYHDYMWSSYAQVPFLRQIDAVFVDPTTSRTVFIANEWYYAFDRYGGFDKQGSWNYLWSDFQYHSYIDSVLITRNKTLCRFYNDQIHCTPFNERLKRPNLPRPFGEVFGAAVTEQQQLPAFPLKGSFWMSDRNQTILLDSNDTFWVYDSNYQWMHTKPFCEFEEFGKFPCCKQPSIEEDASDRDTVPETSDRGDGKTPETGNETINPTQEYSSNSAEEFSQFWSTVWQSILQF